MDRENNFNQRRKVAQAVATALMVMSASAAHAACSGGIGSPYATSATEFCTGADGSLSNSANITSTLSISNSNNALIQFEGLGQLA